MKRIIGAVCLLLSVLVIGLIIEMPTEATPAIMESFSARYGPALTSKYACDLCHEGGDTSVFNPYGQDLGDALVASGACLDFYPPTTHTISKGRCEYMHAEGLFTPFSSKCTYCHGAKLEGLIAPSCYLCHGKRWSEGGPVPAALNDLPIHPTDVNDAFASIEPLDSDGDGYSNIEEINANTHPGDPGSFPGSMPVVDVNLDTNWDRGWIDSRKELVVDLMPEGTTTVDTLSPVYLVTKDGELATTNVKDKGSKVQATFPQALIYTLFKDLNTKTADVTIKGKTGSDEEFMSDVNVKLSGNAPDLLAGLSAKSNVKLWSSGKDVKVTIKGKDAGLIDTSKSVTLISVFKSITVKDISTSGSNVVVNISSDVMEKLIGDPVEGVSYTIGLLGSSTEAGREMAVSFSQKASSSSDCYDFKPPSSHTVEKVLGDCTYYHAPGLEEPFSNNCSMCHGSDLRGSLGPSCYLCHGQLWSSAPQLNSDRK